MMQHYTKNILLLFTFIFLLSAITTNAQDEIWLEVECGSISSDWSEISNTNASQGSYLEASTTANLAAAPTNETGISSYSFNANAGTYNMFGLTKLLNGSSDSFWIRVNNSEWVKWNFFSDYTDSFVWRKVHNQPGTQSVRPVTFNLIQGENNLDIAIREQGASIDKFYFSQASNAPIGLGEFASNCEVDQNEPEVTGFYGSDASGENPRFELVEGGRYNNEPNSLTEFFEQIPHNIIATTVGEVGSVEFELSGAREFTSEDNSTSFAVFSEYGTYFSSGFYTLTATPYSESNSAGIKGEPFTINFEVYNSCVEAQDLAYVVTTPSSCGPASGTVVLNSGLPVGPDDINWSHDVTLTGDVATGLLPGDYSVNFSNGTSCSGLIDFTIEEGENCPDELSISSFTMINADTNEALFDISEGMQININDLPTTNLNIRANATNDVQSIRFTDPSLFYYSSDSSLPYELDEERFIQVGAYHLFALPYSEENLEGEIGTAAGLRFEIYNECLELKDEILIETFPASCSGDDGRVIIYSGLVVDDVENDFQGWEYDSELDGYVLNGLASGTYSVFIGNTICAEIKNYTIEEVTDCPDPDDFTLRINTGGTETDYNGESFIVDTYFNTGSTLDRPQTGLPEPYQSFRFSRSQLMSYDIPLEDGEYTVNLYFAELWFGATGGGSGGIGSRVFDVSIEGQLVEDNLDVFAEVSADAMLMKSHTVTVTGGVLNINFDSSDAVGGTRHPIINAIEILGNSTQVSRPFITTWNTNNIGISENNQITIPTYSTYEQYNYTIFWGDGTFDSNVTADITHTYENSGVYQIAISGMFPQIRIGDHDSDSILTDALKLIAVNQWGDLEWSGMSSSFTNCMNMDVLATDIPNLDQVISLGEMFTGCTSLIGNESFNAWDVSSVTQMSGMFRSATSFNQDISDWDVANVTTMSSMFSKAKAFNQNLGNWNVSKVTRMAGMFASATEFNQPIGNWNVSNVTDMSAMFSRASSFNQPIGDWNVSNVTLMRSMFSRASFFNQIIGEWDLSSVTDTSFMFKEASNFNQPIGDWNTSKVMDMRWMFDLCTLFDQNLANWNVEKVADMTSMFRGTTLSVENYDSLLNSWSTQQLQPNVILNGGNSRYCQGEDARQKLIDDFGWSITDLGRAVDCPFQNDTALRINTGGGVTEFNGETFISDTYYNVGSRLDRPQTGLPEPFQTFRYSRSQEMSYDIPLEDGEYTVNLYFAELWFGATGGGSGGVGSRVFDVSIEGQLAEDNLDIFAEVGADAMLMRTHSVTVVGGVLDIDFSSLAAVGGVRHPVINAIEIIGNVTSVPTLALRGKSANTNKSVLSPNPVISTTSLSFEKAVQLSDIQVFDVAGRLVRTYNAAEVSANGVYNLKVYDLESGTYFINAIDNQGIKHQKQMVIKK